MYSDLTNTKSHRGTLTIMPATRESAPSTAPYKVDTTPAFDPNDPRFDVIDAEPLPDTDQGPAPDVIDDSQELPAHSDTANAYDRVASFMNKLSEGAADRRETRAKIKSKLIGFGKSALRITATTGAVIVGAPFVAVGGAGYLAYKGGQKGAEIAQNVASTVKNEASYIAGEIKGDFITAKDEAKAFFKEKAANAVARKNARLAKISGGFNRIKNNVGEKVTEANRRRRALGARAVAIVDRARTAKDAAKSAWNETGEETSLY